MGCGVFIAAEAAPTDPCSYISGPLKLDPFYPALFPRGSADDILGAYFLYNAGKPQGGNHTWLLFVIYWLLLD